MRPFAQATVSGTLKSGAAANLPTIPVYFWQNQLHTSYPALEARPAVGGPNGAQPDTPNDRMMESLGSSDYLYPFLPVDKQINGPKGRIMAGAAATSEDVVTQLAEDAANFDTQEHADELLQSIRVVSFVLGSTSQYRINTTPGLRNV
jgi:chitinase